MELIILSILLIFIIVYGGMSIIEISVAIKMIEERNREMYKERTRLINSL